jgi:hypothetical protein
MRTTASRIARSRAFGLAVLGGAVLAFCLVRRAATSDFPGAGTSAEPGLVDGRVWVDARPLKLTDYVNAALFVSDANFGLFQRASSYDIRLELFDMTRDEGTIRLTFPQSSRSASFRYTVRECRDRKPFDLCLDISSNPWGGPLHYYGFSRPDDERQALGALAGTLRARVAGPQIPSAPPR